MRADHLALGTYTTSLAFLQWREEEMEMQNKAWDPHVKGTCLWTRLMSP